MFPRYDSELWCEIGGTGALPLGEKSLSTPPVEPILCECALLCPLSPLCRLTGYTVGRPVVGLMCLRRYFHQAISTDSLKVGLSTVVVMPLDLLW